MTEREYASCDSLGYFRSISEVLVSVKVEMKRWLS